MVLGKTGRRYLGIHMLIPANGLLCYCEAPLVSHYFFNNMYNKLPIICVAAYSRLPYWSQLHSIQKMEEQKRL